MELKNIERRGDASVFKCIDWLTILIYLILVVAGAMSIYAASYDFDGAGMFDWGEFSGKQFVWIGLSLILGCVIMLIDYRMYEAYAYPIYGCVILLLLITIFAAPDIKGSRSWLVFGPVSLQPAEFGKFATALALAKLFDSYNFRLNASLSNYARALIIIFVPIMLILLQKETGSALVYLSLIFVLYREGMSGLILCAILLAVVYFVVAVKYTTPLIIGLPCGEFTVLAIITVVYTLMLWYYCKDNKLATYTSYWIAGCALLETILWTIGVHVNGYLFFAVMLGMSLVYTLFVMIRHKAQKYAVTLGFMVVSVGFLFSVGYVFGNVLQPHQQQRIKVTLGIEDDIRASGYNVNQSKIAIGSGGLTGKGFLNGTQTKLKYVPEQHTDFIFCTIGEEEGFVGTVSLLVVYLALILRLVHIAERQPTPFGRVYAYCVVSYLTFHLCINVGMVIGLCPVIGIPLPFLSYGGSSLWGFTILLFILLRIDASRKQRLR